MACVYPKTHDQYQRTVQAVGRKDISFKSVAIIEGQLQINVIIKEIFYYKQIHNVLVGRCAHYFTIDQINSTNLTFLRYCYPTHAWRQPNSFFSSSNQNRLSSFRADYDPMNVIVRFMIVCVLHPNRFNFYVLILFVLFTYVCDLSLSFFYIFTLNSLENF